MKVKRGINLNIENAFCDILLRDKNNVKVKKSSLIKQWLGRSDVPHSVSIRLGNYLETFFRQMMGEYNTLSSLTPSGKTFTITVDGEIHQVDLLGTIDGETWIVREMKCNLDLDRGKIRDTLDRETKIEKGLKEQFNVKVDSGVFCPFFYGITRKDNKFNTIYGLEWFICTFQCNFTVEDFQQMGKSLKIHSLLFK